MMDERHPSGAHDTGQPAPEKKRSVVIGMVVAAILVALLLMLLVGVFAG